MTEKILWPMWCVYAACENLSGVKRVLWCQKSLNIATWDIVFCSPGSFSQEASYEKLKSQGYTPVILP